MNPGDDVIVDFEGIPHLGHIERIERGWARCKILVDAEADYGSITPRLDPIQTVMVPMARVTPRG